MTPPCAAPAADDALERLDALLGTTGALIGELQAALSAIHQELAQQAAPPAASASSDALRLARDAASLVRAHSTKLALLATAAPPSPRALAAEVRALVAGPLPARPGIAAWCGASWSCARGLLARLHALLATLPRGDDAQPRRSRAPASAAAPDAPTQAAGILWSACDDVVKCADEGARGLLVERVRGCALVLKDTAEELKEWSQEVDDDDDDARSQDSESGLTSAQAMVDSLLRAPRPIPADDPSGLRPRLTAALRRLRLTSLLYEAATKRRFNTLPTLPTADASLPPRLDALHAQLQALPARFDDLAAALYRLSTQDVDAALQHCVTDAAAAAELLAATWDGGTDAFSLWIQRFQSQIRMPVDADV